MRKMSKSLIFALFVGLICFPPLHAQPPHKKPANPDPAPTQAPADSSLPADPAPAGQAPDAVTNKITDLVHDGKYAEAQHLTTGLLLAYPDDQRLIKARALLEKLLAPGGAANAAPGRNQPTDNAAPAQSAANANAEQLSGRERLDYDALIELVRQAQQTADMEEQKSSLKQFMDESRLFLQKHPDQMLLWQLRAASAISLNDPMAGYEAGQRLLAAGAADSNDPSLRQLLAQLKNKGWLDKQKVEDYKKEGWILGTWSSSWSSTAGDVRDQGNIVFSKSDSRDIKSYGLQADGTYGGNVFRGTILNPGEIRWEVYFNPRMGCCPSGWQPVISCEIGDGKRTMKLLVPSQWATNKDSRNSSRQRPNTYVLTKLSDSQSH